MGLDALGGYVFARMAHNEGIPLLRLIQEISADPLSPSPQLSQL